MFWLACSLFPFYPGSALSFHAWTPNAGYKLQRTGYHCQFAKCLSSNTAHKKNISEESQDTFTCQTTMWTHWEAVSGPSSRVWFIITQQLKHSPQMQVDSTFVTMKDFDTYWSQGKDTEWWRWSGCSAESLPLCPASVSAFRLFIKNL